MRNRIKVDKPFLIIAVILVVAGFFIFSSASLGLLAKESSNYSSVAFSQTVLGLFLGTIAMILAARLDYKIWKKWAFYLLVLAVILNIIVLVPSIGFEHGGARRWLMIGDLSFQPSEALKFAFIIYFAAWAAGIKEKIKTFSSGFLPLIILLGLCGILLLSQPDTDTYMVIAATGIAMFVAAGGRWRHVLILGLIGLIGLIGLAIARPYVMQRITTFLNPTSDSLGSGYQIQQSLIAIGSGGLFGTGFGQSVQKFTYLPEPVGDSIFAVAGEEFGFVGSVLLIAIFTLFAVRGLKIAGNIPDTFGRLVVAGIVIMIISQAFVNIGAMLGVIPLSGITLPFVSHGGTSLFISLFEIGVILSISKHQKQ
ncbi:MAG: cell division protein FtsW [Candidatus Zambryskibacteria bacterium RIFCSPHIGHO2_01_FULL_49_18]|uniref:Probable peptidoglycan glycosyltransferase FtsW n=2 Tax=Candidatus Zambryskiibacteriota TaxID=1817925 RepID=A0A1G2T429_9BACT|nr:MAG: cell division protein FtsW [Candidatus Zambryskibacteria bacterium RIFCSPHIGHO2_01_FULL_49_18]OHB04992.1 MAG: cell division protein FtsW [Candidatus Zambryskibacteria bacterium RIFCSPLOWO2_01_FULL_47_14]